MAKIVLEIPEDDIEEVVHLLRYACREQRVSNDVWTLLMPFCEEQSKVKLSAEDYLTYATKHSNQK